MCGGEKTNKDVFNFSDWHQELAFAHGLNLAVAFLLLIKFFPPGWQCVFEHDDELSTVRMRRPCQCLIAFIGLVALPNLGL